jgi:hypothetical protein
MTEDDTETDSTAYTKKTPTPRKTLNKIKWICEDGTGLIASARQ